MIMKICNLILLAFLVQLLISCATTNGKDYRFRRVGPIVADSLESLRFKNFELDSAKRQLEKLLLRCREGTPRDHHLTAIVGQVVDTSFIAENRE